MAKAIAITHRKMDDSGEGERIFRLQMRHYLNYYAEPGIEDPLNVNDFLGLLHCVRNTRRWKKRGQQLLNHLHQIQAPAPNEALEHTLIHHYYRACFLWHFYMVDGAEKPTTLGAAVQHKAVPIMKPVRYFFQQLVSSHVLKRRKRSSFDLARPFADAFSTTLQMITEIIESDKLLHETVWNYGMFMNALNGCVSYTAPCRRTTWVLRLRRLVSGNLAPYQKNTTRRHSRTRGKHQTRKSSKSKEAEEPAL